MSKDLWVDTFEEQLNELLDSGLSFDQAYEKAAGNTDKRYKDKLSDLADQARTERKEVK